MNPEAAQPDEPRIRPRIPVHGSPLQTVLLVIVGVVALGAAGVAVWYKLTHKPEPAPRNPAREFDQLNFSFEPPPSPWAPDDDTKDRLGSPYKLVYKRDNPEAFMAFGAQNYESRSPRPGELRGGLTDPLARILEPGTLQESDPEETTWMGKEVKGFNFRGQLRTGPAVQGEAYAVTFKGVGYWFLAWTGENETYQGQKAAFAEARKKCRLLDERKDWKEKQAPVVAFKNNVLGYTLLDAEGIWKEESVEGLLDEERSHADKFLRAKRSRKGSDFFDEAELTVYVLDPADDPLRAARAHVEAVVNADAGLRGKTTFAEFTDPLAGEPMPDDVDGDAPVILLTSTNAKDPNQARLWVISAIKVQDKGGEKVVAAVARCPLRERAAFDTRLVQIAKTLRAGG